MLLHCMIMIANSMLLLWMEKYYPLFTIFRICVRRLMTTGMVKLFEWICNIWKWFKFLFYIKYVEIESRTKSRLIFLETFYSIIKKEQISTFFREQFAFWLEFQFKKQTRKRYLFVQNDENGFHPWQGTWKMIYWKRWLNFFEIVNFLGRKRKEMCKMRTSMEKVRPEANKFACLGRIIKEKAISKGSCWSLR